MAEEPHMETRAEEMARRIAEQAARRVLISTFSRAGYNIDCEEDMQKLVEDMRFLADQRARAKYRREHQFKAWMVVLGAVLTAGLGAIGAFVAALVINLINHNGGQ